jgi:hypothetical protein
MTNNMSFCHLCVNVLGYLPRALSQRTSERKLKYGQLDAAELAAVTGGNVASDLGKIGWGLTAGLIGGAVAGAGAAAFYVLTDAFFNHISSTCGQCGENLGQPM